MEKANKKKLNRGKAPKWRELSRVVLLFYSQCLHSLLLPLHQNTLTMQHHHPHPHSHFATAPAGASGMSSDSKRGKKRGSYNCGRCGLPKKGHDCHVKSPIPPSAASPIDSSVSNFSTISEPSSFSAIRQPSLRQPYSYLRRALSFDNADDQTGGFDPPAPDDREAGDPYSSDLDSCGLPVNVLWDVLRRLPPAGLLSAANVCKGWRDTARRVWRAAEELRLRVPARAQVGFVASILQKCASLVRLSLRMERCGLYLIRRTLSDLQFYVADPVKLN